jgi:hypothetical protein
MNNFRNALFPSFLVLLFLLFVPSGAEASCTKVAGEIVFAGGENPVQDNGVAGDQCNDIPDAYLVTFNKLGVCKSNPLKGAAAFGAPDFNSCQFMYNGPDLITEIRHPNLTSLTIPPFIIEPGSYGFLVAVLSNKLGMKHTATFDNNVSGTGISSGTTCWTSGGTTTFHNEVVTTPHGTSTVGKTIECGTAAAAAPVFNFEVFTHFQGAADSCTDFDTVGEFANGGISEPLFNSGGTTFARVLTGNQAYASNCGNSAKLAWVVTQTSPFIVTPTSRYQLEFKLTDAVSIDMDGAGGIVKMGNDPIQALLTIFE